jgi:hypothetical protein
MNNYSRTEISYNPHIKMTCVLLTFENHMFFLLMLLKKHVKSTCYLNNMYFLYANEHISILYVGCRKFSTNRFVCAISIYPLLLDRVLYLSIILF